MKKIISVSLAAALSLSSIPAQAGFLSTFFANVASDSLQSKGGRYSSDPLIKEKKIQGALAVLTLYKGELDGDFDTFESRTAIKKFQSNFNLEQTGFLSDTEKDQLTYLSNLYVDLKKENVSESKKIDLYNEIDITLESMKNKNFIEEHLPYFSDGRILLISDLDDSDVYINGEKVGSTILGYFRYTIDSGKHSIKLKSLSSQGLWSYQGEKEVEVDSGKISLTTLEINQSKKATKLQASLKASSDVIFDAKSGLYFLDNMEKRIKPLDEAIEYCKNLSISGVSNWRVPSLNELQSMYSIRSKFKDYSNFLNGRYPAYWSSTLKYPKQYHWLNFKNGKGSYYFASDYYNFRCVVS